jgi:hypothetical protein
VVGDNLRKLRTDTPSSRLARVHCILSNACAVTAAVAIEVRPCSTLRMSTVTPKEMFKFVCKKWFSCFLGWPEKVDAENQAVTAKTAVVRNSNARLDLLVAMPTSHLSVGGVL